MPNETKLVQKPSSTRRVSFIEATGNTITKEQLAEHVDKARVTYENLIEAQRQNTCINVSELDRLIN